MPGLGVETPGYPTEQLPFYEEISPAPVESPEPQEFPAGDSIEPGPPVTYPPLETYPPPETYPGETEYESKVSSKVVTHPQGQEKSIPFGCPDIDVKIEHTLKNNQKENEEFYVHPAGGVGGIVGYLGTDEKIIDSNKLNQQIRNDFLEKVIHEELKDAAKQDKIDNKKVNSLFNRSVLGAAYAGCSGMSAAARGLALGKVVRVEVVPPGTPGVPEKGGPGVYKNPKDPQAKEVGCSRSL